ncbi:MAG TPA: universal stress protein [Chthoniobacterales bacterium]
MEPTISEKPIASAIQLKKILVPVDFSEPSEEALRQAVRFADQFGAAITLLHVMPAPVAAFPEVAAYCDNVEQNLECAEAALQTMAAHPMLKKRRVRTEVRSGLAAHEIVEAAREFDSDLIVIATHGYTGWKHFCIGSTTERVVRTAPCPVFVVREKKRHAIH